MQKEWKKPSKGQKSEGQASQRKLVSERRNTDHSLVETDHVSWILASDWSHSAILMSHTQGGKWSRGRDYSEMMKPRGEYFAENLVEN